MSKIAIVIHGLLFIVLSPLALVASASLTALLLALAVIISPLIIVATSAVLSIEIVFYIKARFSPTVNYTDIEPIKNSSVFSELNYVTILSSIILGLALAPLCTIGTFAVIAAASVFILPCLTGLLSYWVAENIMSGFEWLFFKTLQLGPSSTAVMFDELKPHGPFVVAENDEDKLPTTGLKIPTTRHNQPVKKTLHEPDNLHVTPQTITFI